MPSHTPWPLLRLEDELSALRAAALDETLPLVDRLEAVVRRLEIASDQLEAQASLAEKDEWA